MSILGGAAIYWVGRKLEDRKEPLFSTTAYVLQFGGIVLGIAGVLDWVFAPPRVYLPTVAVGSGGVHMPGMTVNQDGVFMPGMAVTHGGVFMS